MNSKLAVPDFLIDSLRSNGFDTEKDFTGNTYSTKYKYYVPESKGKILDIANEYIDYSKNNGLTINPINETEFSITANNKEIAMLVIDESNNAMTLDVHESPQTKISLGQKIESKNYSFTLNSITWEDTINPPNTSGYYLYKEKKPNKSYCLIKGTFKYTGTDLYSFDDTSALLKLNGEYNISANVGYAQDGFNRIEDYYAIEPLDEVQVYIYASVSDEIVNDFTGGYLKWKFKSTGDEYFLPIA